MKIISFLIFATLANENVFSPSSLLFCQKTQVNGLRRTSRFASCDSVKTQGLAAKEYVGVGWASPEWSTRACSGMMRVTVLELAFPTVD